MNHADEIVCENPPRRRIRLFWRIGFWISAVLSLVYFAAWLFHPVQDWLPRPIEPYRTPFEQITLWYARSVDVSGFIKLSTCWGCFATVAFWRASVGKPARRLLWIYAVPQLVAELLYLVAVWYRNRIPLAEHYSDSRAWLSFAGECFWFGIPLSLLAIGQGWRGLWRAIVVSPAMVRRLRPLLRSRLFWIGAGGAAAIVTAVALVNGMPAMPDDHAEAAAAAWYWRQEIQHIDAMPPERLTDEIRWMRRRDREALELLGTNPELCCGAGPFCISCQRLLPTDALAIRWIDHGFRVVGVYLREKRTGWTIECEDPEWFGGENIQQAYRGTMNRVAVVKCVHDKFNWLRLGQVRIPDKFDLTSAGRGSSTALSV